MTAQIQTEDLSQTQSLRLTVQHAPRGGALNWKLGAWMKNVAVRKFVTVATMATLLVCAIEVAPASARPKAPVEAAPYNWTGFYAGVSAGYGWSPGSAGLSGIDTILYSPYIKGKTIPGSADLNSKGLLGGIEVGYNYQIGRTVFGVEADFSGAHIAGSNSFVSPNDPFNPTITTQQQKQLKWLSTFRGRVGYLPTPSLLAFVTGGLAVGRGIASTTTTVAPPPGGTANCIAGDPFANFLCSTGSSAKTMTGWTLGAGLEMMIARNWSAKVEYLYYDLGQTSYTDFSSAFAVGTPVMQSSTRFNGSIVRLGVNYLFN